MNKGQVYAIKYSAPRRGTHCRITVFPFSGLRLGSGRQKRTQTILPSNTVLEHTPSTSHLWALGSRQRVESRIWKMRGGQGKVLPEGSVHESRRRRCRLPGEKHSIISSSKLFVCLPTYARSISSEEIGSKCQSLLQSTSSNKKQMSKDLIENIYCIFQRKLLYSQNIHIKVAKPSPSSGYSACH